MMNIMIYEDNRECIGNLQGILREYFEERSIMFSMFITKLGAFCDFLENEYDCFNPETGELMLGDIVISLDKVEEQAANYGHSVTREYAFLIAHSMLHLMGYDHMEENDAKEMERRQAEILESLGIGRQI